MVSKLTRPMSGTDVSGVLRVDRLCFGDEVWSQSDWENIVSQEHVYASVVEHNGKIVGFLVIEPRDGNRSAVLRSIAVEPDRQRSGHGGTLMSQAQADLPSQSVESLVEEDNLGTQLFMRSQGFVANKQVIESPFFGKTMYRFSRAAK